MPKREFPQSAYKKTEATHPAPPLAVHHPVKTFIEYRAFIIESSKLCGIYTGNQMRWCTGVSGQGKSVCGGIRRRRRRGGGFHIISVKCFYLTAVTLLDKLASAQVFEVNYKINFRTRVVFSRLTKAILLSDWRLQAGRPRPNYTHGDSEGQCKEQRRVLVLSVLNHVWQSSGEMQGTRGQSALDIGSIWPVLLIRWPHNASVYSDLWRFCLGFT